MEEEEKKKKKKICSCADAPRTGRKGCKYRLEWLKALIELRKLQVGISK
ncbi:MAG: hypothetical protein ACE5NL_01290 [Candidatus Hydrothermarchaeaceae archaeon]